MRLRVLDVEGCEGLTAACLPHLGTLMRLTHLNLGQCPGLKGHNLHHIAGEAPLGCGAAAGWGKCGSGRSMVQSRARRAEMQRWKAKIGWSGGAAGCMASLSASHSSLFACQRRSLDRAECRALHYILTCVQVFAQSHLSVSLFCWACACVLALPACRPARPAAPVFGMVPRSGRRGL